MEFCIEALTTSGDRDADVLITDESRSGVYADSRALGIQPGVFVRHSDKIEEKGFMCWGSVVNRYKNKHGRIQ
jgi:hypothetical protein